MSRHGDKHGHGHGRTFNHPILESLGIGALSVGGAAAAIGASWKIAEFLVKSKKLLEVRSENAVYVRLVERVKVDLAEAERLMALKSVQDGMRGNRPKTLYIQSLIHGVHEAIEAMTKYTSRVAGAGWWLGLPARLWWVLHEQEKLAHRQMELAMAREGIMEVIGWLSEFEEAPGNRKETPDNRKESLESGRRTSEKPGETGRDTRHTSNHVDVNVRIDPERRHEHRDEHHERRFVEPDHGRPPMRRDEQHRRYEYVEEDFEVESPYRRDDWAQSGFYDGRPDGPLATRPRFSGQQSAGANFTEPNVGDRVVEGGIPQRVPWFNTSKL